MDDFPRGSNEDFEKFLVKKYFQFGSVDQVLKKYRFALPISYAQYQRILDKFGVIKTVGPNGKFSESLEFLSKLVHDNMDFDKVFKKLPPSYKTSASTFYRILSYVKEGITRRVGVALIITDPKNIKKILIAKDVSMPRIELGKYFGDYSLPMGYAKKSDSRITNIKRILQQEVFTNLVVDRLLPNDVILDAPDPFMYLDIADVRVAVFQIQINKLLLKNKNFSSYKLKDYVFVDSSEIVSNTYKTRLGVVEAVKGYMKYLGYMQKNLRVNPLQARSVLNTKLVEAIIEFEN